MAPLKTKGDLAELAVAAELVARGYRVAFPTGRTAISCFFIPAAELGTGRAILRLRLTPARNGQRARIRHAAAYTAI